MSAVPLADVKAHLNVDDDGSSGELQRTLDAAESAIAQRVGPLTPTHVTQRVAGGSVLVVDQTPVISLTSVTPVGGAALSLAGLFLDVESGVVTRTGSSFPDAAYDVVYQAGRATLDKDLVQAVLEMTRHLWAPQRGAGGAGRGREQREPTSRLTYAIPNAVAELIEPHEDLGGFA